jgi:hypothetical protein
LDSEKRLEKELKGEVRKGGFDGIYFNVTLETKQLDFAVQPAVALLNYKRN